jgi:2'-hydroxyisoflavone reductase
MHILIIGGTLFVGRALVEAALARGHRVTLFNRGKTNPELFPRVVSRRGDRNDGFAPLAGMAFDAIIDTCGYFPRQLERAIEELGASSPCYLFISTCSVYRDHDLESVTEEAPLQELPDPSVEEITGETYGGLKALCEQRLQAAWPGRLQIVRPGLIVGPWDPSGRFSYWLRRMHEGGTVLAPGNPDGPVQFIDVRDLAEFCLGLCASGTSTVVNAVGPAEPLGFGRFLDVCAEHSGTPSRCIWADDDFLEEQGVTPFHELPLWVPASQRGFFRVSCERAKAAGLVHRPWQDTVRDTLAWSLERSADFERGQDPRRPGMSPVRENLLLQRLQATGA